MRSKGKITGLLAALTLLVVVVAVGANRSRLVAWWEFRQKLESLGKGERGYPETPEMA